MPSGFSSGDVLIPLADEYDPMFPNDYEKVVKRHREERQRQREQERQKEIEEREKYCHNFTQCLTCVIVICQKNTQKLLSWCVAGRGKTGTTVELPAVSLVSRQQRATQMRRRNMRKKGEKEVSISHCFVQS